MEDLSFSVVFWGSRDELHWVVWYFSYVQIAGIKGLNWMKLRVCPHAGKKLMLGHSQYVCIFSTNGFKLFSGADIMIS